MKNKVTAFLDRGEIRDCFDIEFLLRRNIALPPLNTTTAKQFLNKMKRFKQADYKVKLGSIVEENVRQFYISQKFTYLREKLGTTHLTANKK